MYKDYFALKNNVFDSHSADGSDFTGSQQAAVRSQLTEALSAGDTIVALTGPVGSGKTTLVQAAIEAISGTRVVARIARIQLRHDEVLELLLAELGVERQPAGTIQRFTKLKRLFKKWQEQETRVFIIVEDAQRIGADALSELESLTSRDSGGAAGASIILMGLPELDELLGSDDLTRMRQRISQKLTLKPFSATEVQEYLAHRLETAGGKVEELFENGAIDMIFRCTGGSPRVINKLSEAVLAAAAKAESKTVSPYQVQQVAAKQFGLKPAAKIDVSDIALSTPEPSKIDEEIKPEEDEIPHLIQDTLPGVAALTENDSIEKETPVTAEPATESSPVTEPSQMTLEPHAPEALVRTSVDTASVKQLDDALRPDTQLLATLDEIPAIADDVAPVPLGLQNQMPPPASEATQKPAAIAPAEATDKPTTEAPETDIPTLSDSMRIKPVPQAAPAEKTGDTQTLKRPNIEALQSALATARKGPVEIEAQQVVAQPAAAEESTPGAETPAANTAGTDTPAPGPSNIPEITLDNALEKRQKEAEALLEARQQAALKAQEQEADDAEAVAESENPVEAQEEVEPQEPVEAEPSAADIEAAAAERAKLGKLAADLGSAKSLEEIDDMAAETLFGEEFSQIAAAVAAMAAADSANDSDMDADPASEHEDEQITLVSDDDKPVESQAPAASEDEVPVSFESVLPVDESPAPDINASASRRFAMLKAMNEPNHAAANLSTPQEPAGDSDGKTAPDEVAESAAKKGPQVAPIENQFGSSMTQTLEALKFERPAGAEDDDEDEDEKSGGFMSRFKRS
jgi:type II secretory pathway predicted ATPase ExeA